MPREMVPPKNVKQVQSFLQTYSWYRRFTSNFAEKSRPLSNLTKMYASWKWEEEQKALNTLTQCLTTAPILKQVDDTKPFVIRTDASNYAIGAVLLKYCTPDNCLISVLGLTLLRNFVRIRRKSGYFTTRLLFCY
ncbi:hypothetical protein AVEN_210425-1 [Araneus ventricosus]|uniref:RNA-directed DNA polymerase n=1 Tax=Araneus ventricosus TaxID=182803 RepID=A0A4Y2M563_ARAVE|nr:hypothetical protein AVEN_9235-1 [Araneus ventricosus]GBN22131.1 hypothetical protein AVEN_210425-1 [Araneus ventricosus]